VVALSLPGGGGYSSSMTLFPQPDPVPAPLDGAWIDAGWATATGPRADNQDRAAVAPTWAVVSDGAGGHRGGALAAQLTVDAAVTRLTAAAGGGDRRIVADVVAEADAAVRARQAADPEVATMAATLTLAVASSIGPDGSAWIVADVGDSPAWSLTGGHLTRVSEEDNVAAELVRAGAISRAEARQHPGRHVITQAVGGVEAATATAADVALRPGDGLVLASDGVEVVDETAMMEVVSGAPTAAQAARRLVDAALARGATDNVTVAVVRHRRQRRQAVDPGGGGPGR
jgi:serine/threonine protein phosphatase PrpC